MQQWTDGIVYLYHPNICTVPMAELEEGLSTGKQKQKDSGSVAWRVGLRKDIMNLKVIIYAALGAQHRGKDMVAFMNAHQAQAEERLKAHQGRRTGNVSSVMHQLIILLQSRSDFLPALEFESQILGWKITEQRMKQSKSRRAKSSYPPAGITPAL